MCGHFFSINSEQLNATQAEIGIALDVLWTFWLKFEHSLDLPLTAADHRTSMFNTGKFKIKDRSWDVVELYTN